MGAMEVVDQDAKACQSLTTAVNPVLEPSSSTFSDKLRIVGKKSGGSKGAPNITGPPTSRLGSAAGLLDRVKKFLPELERAEDELKARVEAGESVDIEDISDNDKVIEMNVGITEADPEEDWSSDSDGDSTASPEERDNEFTSDSDLDSSSSSSSSSSSHHSARPKKTSAASSKASSSARTTMAALDATLNNGTQKMRLPGAKRTTPKKRPLIEVIESDNSSDKQSKQQDNSEL